MKVDGGISASACVHSSWRFIIVRLEDEYMPGVEGDDESTIPLTVAQRVRLLGGCLQFVVFVAMVAAFQIFWVPLSGAPNPLFYIFIALVLGLTGHEAYGRLRDLSSGFAVVAEDVLVRAGRSRRPGGGAFWGRFDRLGRLSLTPSAFSRVANGARHRIIYSPKSRLVWSAQPLSSYQRTS
jgi:hypothetical protein